MGHTRILVDDGYATRMSESSGQDLTWGPRIVTCIQSMSRPVAAICTRKISESPEIQGTWRESQEKGACPWPGGRRPLGSRNPADLKNVSQGPQHQSGWTDQRAEDDCYWQDTAPEERPQCLSPPNRNRRVSVQPRNFSDRVSTSDGANPPLAKPSQRRVMRSHLSVETPNLPSSFRRRRQSSGSSPAINCDRNPPTASKASTRASASPPQAKVSPTGVSHSKSQS